MSVPNNRPWLPIGLDAAPADRTVTRTRSTLLRRTLGSDTPTPDVATIVVVAPATDTGSVMAVFNCATAVWVNDFSRRWPHRRSRANSYPGADRPRPPAKRDHLRRPGLERHIEAGWHVLQDFTPAEPEHPSPGTWNRLPGRAPCRLTTATSSRTAIPAPRRPDDPRTRTSTTVGGSPCRLEHRHVRELERNRKRALDVCSPATTSHTVGQPAPPT
jgi:hypothetical protein